MTRIVTGGYTDSPTDPPLIRHDRCRRNIFTEPLLSIEKWIHSIEPLPSNDRSNKHSDAQTDGKDFFKYAVDIGSGVVICKKNL